MRFVSSTDLKKIINEAVSELLNEGKMPFAPLGGGAAKPSGSKMPFSPLGGGAAKPSGGKMPFSPLGGGAPAQPDNSATPTNSANSSSANPQDAQSDDVDMKGGSDGKTHRPGILKAVYEPFYETRDPNESDKDVLKIWLTYINSLAVQKFISFLNQNFGDILYSPMPNMDATTRIPKNFTKSDGTPLEDGFNKYWVKIIIRPGKNDDFIQKIPSIVDGLYQILDQAFSSNKPKRGGRGKFQGNSGNISYDESYKPTYEQYLIDMVEKTPTPDEMKQVDVKIAQNVRELLMHLRDPEVQKRLGMIRVIVGSPRRQQINGLKQNKNLSGDDGKLAGWVLSPRNAAKVLAQDPNATYVAQEHVWRKWGHEVVDKSKYIVVNMPTTWKKFDKKAFDKACREFGFAGGADEYAYAKKNKMYVETPQKYYALIHLENLYNPNSTEFGYKKFYDIANTVVVSGRTSDFLPGPDQKQGLSNNIYGEVNAAARTAGYSAPDQSQDDDFSSAPSTSMDPKGVEMFRDALQVIVNSVTGTVPNTVGKVSAERDIVDLAYFYAQYIVNSQYGDMLDDVAELLKKGFSAAVAASVGIADDEAADYLSQALSSTGKDSDLDTLASQWFGEYYELLNDVQKEIQAEISKSKGTRKRKAVAEGIVSESSGIRVLSFDEFKNVLFGKNVKQQYDVQNDDVSAQSIQESFFSFLDRMEGYGE